MRTQKGITLVALLITVIVMLILAGVTIRSLTSDGIIDTTKDAKNQYSFDQDHEELVSLAFQWQAKYSSSGDKSLYEFLTEKFASNENVQIIPNTDNSVTVTMPSGYEFLVSKDGEVSVLDGTGENQPTPIPPQIILTKANITGQIYPGETVTDTITATLNNVKGDLTWTSSNESVATITGEGNTRTITMQGVGTATITVSYETYSSTCNVTVTDAPIQKVTEVQGKVLSTTHNRNVEDAYGNIIIVPAGFMITTDASVVPSGIVVEDCTGTSTDGSEFVWIPVGTVYTNTSKTSSKTITLGRYSSFTSGSTPTSTGNNLTIGSKTYTDSISTFYANTTKGYYIGRYEAGDASSSSDRTGAKDGTLVCKAGQVVYNYVVRDDAKTKASNMYTNKPFISELMNSCAWDTAIMFIQAFGNSDYANASGLSSVDTVNAQRTGTNLISGVVDKQLNIYDMAGNCIEWTTETYGEYAVYRGGFCRDGDFYTSYRLVDLKTDCSPVNTFRPILYITN